MTGTKETKEINRVIFSDMGELVNAYYFGTDALGIAEGFDRLQKEKTDKEERVRRLLEDSEFYFSNFQALGGYYKMS